MHYTERSAVQVSLANALARNDMALEETMQDLIDRLQKTGELTSQLMVRL